MLEASRAEAAVPEPFTCQGMLTAIAEEPPALQETKNQIEPVDISRKLKKAEGTIVTKRGQNICGGFCKVACRMNTVGRDHNVEFS